MGMDSVERRGGKEGGSERRKEGWNIGVAVQKGWKIVRERSVTILNGGFGWRVTREKSLLNGKFGKLGLARLDLVNDFSSGFR